MKQNLMRAPLLKGGAVLLVFMLLVYLTSTSAEGSVWSSITTMVVGAFRLVQWAIGMVIGIALCLAVLFGIFLAAVALVNKDVSAGMYAALKVSLANMLSEGLACVGDIKACARKPQERQAAAAPSPQTREKIAAVVDAGEVEQVNSMLEEQLAELTDKIHALEAKMVAFATHEKLNQVASEVSASGDSLQKLHDLIAGLEGKVDEAAGKMGEISSESILGDLPKRLKSIEEKDVAEKHDIAPIVDLVERMQGELKDTISNLAQPLTEEERAQIEEHRLFIYFEDPKDKEKLESLVSETLKKDMTYAQVMNFLVKEMGKEKGQVLADHPSLAKDYIRQRRRG